MHAQSLFYYSNSKTQRGSRHKCPTGCCFATCLLQGWPLGRTLCILCPRQRAVQAGARNSGSKLTQIPALLPQPLHTQSPPGSHFIVRMTTRQIVFKTNLWKDFGIQVGRTVGNGEKPTSLQTDKVIEMQGRPKRINLSGPVKESWSLCFHFWYLNWQSTSEADIYWSCRLKTILGKFRAHTGERHALNTTGKFLKLLLIAEKKMEINSIYSLGMCMGSI